MCLFLGNFLQIIFATRYATEKIGCPAQEKFNGTKTIAVSNMIVTEYKIPTAE